MHKECPLPTTDEELVLLAQGGDQDASTELDRRYRDKMIHTLAQMYVFRWADSEDIYQEAFLKSIIYFRPGGKSFKNFLFLTARSVAIDYSRKSSDEVSLDELDHNFIADANVKEVESIPPELLSLLKPRARELFTLHYVQGKTWEEVAQQLRYSSADSARTVFKRALQAAARRFKPN